MNTITCTLCGTQYDPALNPSCGSCPLHAGCSTSCCPHCGVSNINPSGSRLARWIENILQGEKQHVSATHSTNTAHSI